MSSSSASRTNNLQVIKAATNIHGPNSLSLQTVSKSLAAKIDNLPEEDVQANLIRTQNALNKAVAAGESKNQLDRAKETVNRQASTFRYTPNPNAAGAVPRMGQRQILMMEKPVDPLEPPRFKHRRAPREDPIDDPTPILHSNAKKLTVEDQNNWKIPPCVSNWKNQKGYTIPLDKRIAADGRNLQETQVNDKFAALTDSLFTAERAAREEIKYRNDLLVHKKKQEEAARESKLREIALKARIEKQKQATELNPEVHAQELERRREIERDMRIERAHKRHTQPSGPY